MLPRTTTTFICLPRLLVNLRLCSSRLPAVGCLPASRHFTAIACSWPPAQAASISHRKLQQQRRSQLPQLQTARGKKDEANLSALFKPVPVRLSPGEVAANTGDGLCGQLDKGELLKLLNRFTQKRETKLLCAENGLDTFLQQQAFSSFRRFCIEEHLPVDLHIIVADILQGAGHVDDIFPYFLRHARKMFPHLECMDDLRNISDLSTPDQWYPEARRRQRRIVFHAGPTNSGKTYHAMQRFMAAKSGVYCGPLKLLATEVFQKCNRLGTVCDLVTGEERRFGRADGEPSAHVACTVEMASISQTYEVAVIDEIQLLRDPGRGWAWTRAFQGLLADEVHVCGEAGTAELLRRLCAKTGEEVVVHQYERLTELTVEPEALQTLDNVQPGDCVVCFSKNDIYAVSREIEARGKEVAVIYGGLPPGTKMAQAEKFNDPGNPCKVMVATDAIGMGLNLSIRRIIFYSLVKPTQNEKGERVIDIISVSSALQIAGRAGRFGTQWPHGYVTTYRAEDLHTLRDILAQSPEPLLQAGLHPTADQIEQYAYHLPNSTLSNLMDIFVSLSTVDDALYFMCNMDDFKFLAEMIQHVPLALRARYVFCCAPINRKMPFVCTMFLKFARQFSRHEPVTFDWLVGGCGWPFARPRTILELVQLESVFDVMDLYLWLSYRFVELFPHAVQVRAAQAELDELIQQGVFQITRLLQNSEKASAKAASSSLSPSGGHSSSTTSTSTATVHRDVLAVGAAAGGGGKGRLTDRLLAQGLLTPSMLNELQSEWNRAGDKHQQQNGVTDQRKSGANNAGGAKKPATARRKRKT